MQVIQREYFENNIARNPIPSSEFRSIIIFSIVYFNNRLTVKSIFRMFKKSSVYLFINQFLLFSVIYSYQEISTYYYT